MWRTLPSKLLVLFLLTFLSGFDLRPATMATAQPRTPQKGSHLILKIAHSIPFSFVYDGKPSQKLLPVWTRRETKIELSEGRERQIITYHDPDTGLEVIDEITLYKGFGAVDWVLRFRNTSHRDTPIIEKIMPLNLFFPAPGDGPLTFNSCHGSEGKPNDYLPIRVNLISGTDYRSEHYVMQGEKQVGTGFPYFDIHWRRGGIIGAIGWTGQWMLHIHSYPGRRIEVQSGQQTTHFLLHPGESVRTPRILLLEWEGADYWSGHNKFRRLLIAHYVPKINGHAPTDPVSHTGAYVLLFDAIARKTGKNPLEILPTLKPSDLTHARGFATPDDALNWVNERNQLKLIHGMPPVGIEAYWLDAGWFEGGWPFGAGNWVPDPTKFPQGLKPLGDAAHARRLQFILWFEPKRVAPGTLIAKQHPEWVLRYPEEGRLGGLFDLGIPAARQWMTHLISQRIEAWDVNIYRNDSNICPLPFWNAADKPDRRGITEDHDVEGLYQFWDNLLKAHPGLMIDNANWRITGPDIEVMKRSIGSLTRSEVDDAGISFPDLDQAETAELSLWVPLDATIVHGLDPYTFRSAATTGVCIGLDLQSKYIPLNELRGAIKELKSLRALWLGDYYPLTQIAADPKAWCGWEFNRPDLGAGFAMLFRRSQSIQASLRINLHGLDPQGRYEVTLAQGYDVAQRRIMKGLQLEKMLCEIDSPAKSLLIRYRRFTQNNGN